MPQKSDQKNEIVYELSRSARCFNCDQKLNAGELVRIQQGQASEYSDEREKEVRCLSCAGLSQMATVSSGNAKLTKLSKKYSKTCFVIMKWSDLWKTYERRGILAESQAVDKAKQEL